MTEPNSATGDREEEIVLDIDAPLATVTIVRADDENRLTRANLERLGEIAETLKASDDVQAVLITGAGGEYFSHGLLNPVIRASLSKDEVLETVILANTVFDAIEALPQIVIAVINGSICAGATELALACDIRLVADHATLALPEAKWGGFPGAGDKGLRTVEFLSPGEVEGTLLGSSKPEFVHPHPSIDDLESKPASPPKSDLHGFRRAERIPALMEILGVTHAETEEIGHALDPETAQSIRFREKTAVTRPGRRGKVGVKGR